MSLLHSSILILSLSTFLVADAAASGRSCKDQSHCQNDECCLFPAYQRGKRAIPEELGSCQSLGKENSGCYMMNVFSEVAKLKCPCGGGLECMGTGLKEVPYGEVGVCVRSKEVPCSTTKDCQENECCFSYYRPIGKRSLHSPTPSMVCKPLMRRGEEGCLVNQGSALDPKQSYFVCPCEAPLLCSPSGLHDVPLGPLGTCEGKQ